MRTIVISDTHLTAHFNPRKCAFLHSIIEPADRVILGGDFWDSYLTSFDRFVRSPWSQLFPLLKDRKAIYLYGNHDPDQASDERVDHFSIEQRNTITFPLSPRRCRGEGEQARTRSDSVLRMFQVQPHGFNLEVRAQLFPSRLGSGRAGALPF